ncbi:RNA polymerase sigma-70 factor (ECF subfamily) [Saonia flava]|uniref:RNA polymerase sigma-70 factor (ECF subfamily) n=1 Tax=Saonia flava TaxID=523696 RepID=A0A846QNU6_9FLAO|nr:RNA polymerase sigma factor [Saonia flava]NJB70736.1 RNA polymerase sigma-70 factor (ECF subfamily) [Saonia flava]
MTFLKKLFLIIIKNQSERGLGKGERYNDLTDEELVDMIVKNNNTMLFGSLYDRYSAKVYNKCYSFSRTEAEAEDLTQDVFLLLFVKLNTFKGKSKFSTWLFSLTYNFCTNYVNRDKQKKIRDKSNPVDDDKHNLVQDVSDESLFKLKTDKLEKALKLIDPEDKSILLLKYQDGVSVKELSQLMEIGESAIKMRLKRSRSRLVEIYNELK